MLMMRRNTSSTTGTGAITTSNSRARFFVLGGQHGGLVALVYVVINALIIAYLTAIFLHDETRRFHNQALPMNSAAAAAVAAPDKNSRAVVTSWESLLDNTKGNEQQQQQQLPDRLDFWADQEPSRQNGDSHHQVLQVVSHRELLIGCHSFAEYLSPHFHTLLVFPRHVARVLQLDKLVQQATAEQTAGVHLFLTESWAGSHMARRLADRFAQTELATRGVHVRYLSSINCDVHPLPRHHERYQPLEDIVLTMVRDLQRANQLQGKKREASSSSSSSLVVNYNAEGYAVDANGQCTNDCDNPIPHRQRRILAMNTILFEDVPDNKTLAGFHGHDTLDWWARGGWERRKQVIGKQQQRALEATKNSSGQGGFYNHDDIPWLQDESQFFEDHMILFDLKALREFSEVYFSVAPEAFPDENNFLGPMAAAHGFTLVRHNDLVLQIQFGHDPVPFDPLVDVDNVRRLNWRLLGRYRSPRFLAANWERAASMAHVTSDHRPFTPFVYMHCRKHVWFPTSWNSSSLVSDPAVLPVLDGFLSYNGYVRIDSNAESDYNTNNNNNDDRATQPKRNKSTLRYALDGIHPATRLVQFGKHSGKPARRFLSLPRKKSSGEYKFQRMYIDHNSAGPPHLNRTAVLEIPAFTVISPDWFDACKD